MDPAGLRILSLILLGCIPTQNHAFAPHLPTTVSSVTPLTARLNQRLSCLKAMGRDDFDDDAEEIDVPLQDWRDFRAKLVMSERPVVSSSSSSATATVVEGDLDGIGSLFETPATTVSSEKFKLTPLDPSQWAYDSGKVIEQGAVILGGVEQDYGFGLRQQYFHKAAILVLDHDETVFTKGIILNRPTDLTLDDDINEGVKWRVWFGGDVQGIDSINPDIVCLHSLKNDQVAEASVSIMKDIQWTTFDNAKRLVKVGLAKPTDFWVFCGYAGWGPGQLMGELDRKSWYMVATDSQTLLKELARLGEGADPRNAGLETWTLLMNMIGRRETAEEYSGDFDDLMLKEWARKHLLSTEAGGGAGQKRRAPQGIASTQELMRNRLLTRVSAAFKGEDVSVGSIVRASGSERSPFLLNDQQLHKSLVLIIADNDVATVGIILNRPFAKGLDINVKQKELSKVVTLPLRFGGYYAVKGSAVLMWLHYNPVLRAAKIGSPVGVDEEGIWKCTAEDVTLAVRRGLASPDQFLVVSGVTIWTKGEKGLARGIQGEIRSGNFEIVPPDRTQQVWNALAKQEILTPVNLLKSVSQAHAAWVAAGGAVGEKKKKQNGILPISGLGEGYDEEDDTLVFKSDVKVSALSEDALRTWIACHLLSSPSLGA